MRCFSRFCSISSWVRKPRMAFFGLSLFFVAAPPPNQPQTPDMVLKTCETRKNEEGGGGGGGGWAERAVVEIERRWW